MSVIEQHRIEIEDSLQEETEELPRLQSLSDVLSEIEDTEYESLYESFDTPELYSITPEIEKVPSFRSGWMSIQKRFAGWLEILD